ncbi:MAG: hypothetical protein ACI8P0_002365 [Planctomycetaceae bacterium]|jgi:hypothetical protein
MKRLCGLELCFLVVVSEIVVGAVSLAAFVHERGRVVAEIKVIGIGRNIFEVASPFPVSRLLDRAFELSQKSFVVGHRTAPVGVGSEFLLGAEAVFGGDVCERRLSRPET